MKPNDQHASGDSASGISSITTSDLELACLLATVGAEPLTMVRIGGQTPSGDGKVCWTFKTDPLAEEVFNLWHNPPPKPEWEAAGPDARALVLRVVTAFVSNRRGFIARAKGLSWSGTAPSSPVSLPRGMERGGRR